MHDFDPIAFVQAVRGMPPARNDLSIHFHRDATPGEVAMLQQFRDRSSGLDAAGFAIEEDVHAYSFARDAAPRQRVRLVTIAAS